MMKKIILATTILIGITHFYAKSQGKISYNYDQRRFNPYLNRFSYTFSLGVSSYNGDLSGFFEPSLQNYYLNPAVGFGMAYRINDRLSVRGEVNGFSLYSESVKYVEKNRTFTGFNIDYYLNAVVDLFPKGRIDGRFHKWDGHLFGGIGQVVFFPNSNETGDSKTGIIITDTATVTTEFNRISVIYPVGAGVKYYLDKNHYLSVEGNYRFTRADFLDALKDLNHLQFDKYFTLFFKYTVIIDTSPRRSFKYEQYIQMRKRHLRE